MLPYSIHPVLNKIFVTIAHVSSEALVGIDYTTEAILQASIAEAIICWLQHFSCSIVGGGCQLPLPYFKQHFGVKCCTELDTKSCKYTTKYWKKIILTYTCLPFSCELYLFTITGARNSKLRLKLACLWFNFSRWKNISTGFHCHIQSWCWLHRELIGPFSLTNFYIPAVGCCRCSATVFALQMPSSHSPGKFTDYFCSLINSATPFIFTKIIHHFAFVSWWFVILV